MGTMKADEYVIAARAQAEVLKSKLEIDTHACCIDVGIELAIASTLGLLFADEPKERV